MRDLESQSSSTRGNSPGQWLRNAFIPALPVLACFLGGATQKWAEGAVVMLLGCYLLIQPPRQSLGAPINWILTALGVCAAIAFLPAGWFFQPPWREALVTDLGISLPATLSAQPWITSTCLMSFIAGLVWLYVVSSQELELRAVRFQLRSFATGVALLAAISVGFYAAHTAPSFWINEPGFGPFPNRNQTGDLLGLTAIVILACGQDDIRQGRKRWIFWLGAFGIVIAATILNFSRAGLVILVLGSAAWLVLFALHKGSVARVGVMLAVLLLLGTTILLAGGQTLERFHLRGFKGTGITSDFRWLIFQDAFQLIRASPWCGIGLGNFEPVFAIFRNVSFADTRSLHPESDWLWLWTELGWPAVALTLVGAAFLIWKVFPLRVGTNQRFRLAALIAASLFALHGLVDVSAHRVGTAYAGVFLLGLALHRPLEAKTSRLLPVVFRFLGLILLIAGISWMVAARAKLLQPGSVGVTNAKQLASVANRGRNYAEAINVTSGAMTWGPLDWQLYFLRAIARVGAKQPEPALDDFRRARFLEPNAYQVPLAEGDTWLVSHPTLAVTAWREALRRAGPDRPGVYSVMLRSASKASPEVMALLEEVGLGQHDLVLSYLQESSGPAFKHGIETLLKNDPDLKALSDTEKLALFTLWSERGDLEELSRRVKQHPDWISYAWLGLARHAAAQNDFRAAYELTQQYGEAVALPRLAGNASLEELQNRYASSPDNYATGYALYREQTQRGRIDDALVTARHFSERANSPPYFHFLEAQCWAAKQNWERAWNAWQAFQAAKAKANR